MAGGKPRDLVFLDVLMPGIDGLETLERIRARDPALPVVMLTATKTVKTAVTAMKLGAFDYLTKPFDIEELRLVAQRATEHSRLTAGSRRAARSRREALPFREHHRRVAGRCRRSSRRSRRWRHSLDGARHRRVRHRQGADRARSIHYQQPARDQAAGHAQLRGHPRQPARERAVRARARLVHRRASRRRSAVRGGRRRHHLPRRDRRDEPGACRPSCCACSRRARSSASAAAGPSTSTCAWSRPPTATCSRPSREGRFRTDLYYRLNVVSRRAAAAARAHASDIPPPDPPLARPARARSSGCRHASSPPDTVERLLALPLAGQRARARERDRAPARC